MFFFFKKKYRRDKKGHKLKKKNRRKEKIKNTKEKGQLMERVQVGTTGELTSRPIQNKCFDKCTIAEKRVFDKLPNGLKIYLIYSILTNA